MTSSAINYIKIFTTFLCNVYGSTYHLIVRGNIDLKIHVTTEWWVAKMTLVYSWFEARNPLFKNRGSIIANHYISSVLLHFIH